MAKRPPKVPLADPHTARMAAGRTTPVSGDLRPRSRQPEPKPKTEVKGPDPVKLLEDRLRRANKVFDKWSQRFECPHLDAYYEGKQWRGVADNDAKRKYVINMVFATVETQLPSLLFSRPKVMVEARPDHQQTATSQAGARATLIEQTLQTFIDDPKVAFTGETSLALRDAYPRFAVVEVGYSADWIDNPNAGRPALKEDGAAILDGEGQGAAPVLQPAKMLRPGTSESLYVKRIPARQYRVSISDTNRLSANDWVGYYEWVQLEDIKQTRDYQHTADLKAGTYTLMAASESESESEADPDLKKHAGMVKLWKIWDLRRKVRIVHAEGSKKILQEKPYSYLPHAVLKFYELPDSFYPVPPIFNWLSPQDEINEIREMQKVHRRRAVRRYMVEPSVTPTEVEKLETGEDMTAISVPKVTPPPIVAIQDAPLDAQNIEVGLSISRDDLNQISGVTGEARNSPNAPTATQANIVNVRASIRESRARGQVAEWLGDIARLMLLTLRDKVQLPFMVKRTIDPFAVHADQPQALAKAQLWQQIDSEAISDLDVDVKIDVSSLSPVAEEAQRNQWNVVLQLLTNPPLMTLLMTPNPQAPDEPSALLRKTLTLHGITSDQEVREIWRVGQAILKGVADAAAAQAAQAKAPEPIRMSLALKGEDLTGPLGSFFLMLIQREENIQATAALTAQPASPFAPGNGKPTGGVTIPAPPSGPPTGTPTAAPAGMGPQ